ncbi:MAG TPA: prepilin-type N-terminal cleavage/methylation domain-containing protein [Rickettsiales bacterium]|nr:prepilin-type N-terminal cleavage/methylation domain-containing protein [Rickettsiales bacterium]
MRNALRSKYYINGFTLIELSIVLVIIGLIVGGVLAGRDLILGAKRRAIISDIEQYKTAVYTFRGKYDAIPGDMANATTYWGALGGGEGSAGSPLTYNGNGNGLVCDKPASYSDIPCDDEPMLFWKHLSNAGLINGGFTGTLTNLGWGGLEIIGQNIPQSRAGENTAYMVFYLCLDNAGTGLSYFKNSFCGHVFTFGGQGNATHNWTNLPMFPALSGIDAYDIDRKLDDGKPGTGSVMSEPIGSDFIPNCTTNTDYTIAAYDMSSPAITCSLMFAGKF